MYSRSTGIDRGDFRAGSNIKVVNYAWPTDCEASVEARDLIKSILSVDPSQSEVPFDSQCFPPLMVLHT